MKGKKSIRMQLKDLLGKPPTHLPGEERGIQFHLNVKGQNIRNDEREKSGVELDNI
jgi:hypothetical protein